MSAHIKTWQERKKLDSGLHDDTHMEDEISDLRAALQAQQGACNECGKEQSAGWALYCVACGESAQQGCHFPLTFEQIEDAFPEAGACSTADGSLHVSAQWMHDFARNIRAIGVQQGEAEEAPESDIAAAIHCPEHWDTMAYPTLESALHELAAWFKCSECKPVPAMLSAAEVAFHVLAPDHQESYADVSSADRERYECVARAVLAAAGSNQGQDAARYRWLRHGDNDELVIQHGPVAPDYHWLPRNDRLDAMIDTHMAAALAAKEAGK